MARSKKGERICKFDGVRRKTLSAATLTTENTPLAFSDQLPPQTFSVQKFFQICYDTIVDGACGTGSRHATCEQMQFACLLGLGFIKKQWT